ncbi:MAG: hypothetical protein NZO16_00130 [Deltaproteobacteria bacterium]|nr:hypothetical protein [Deltaproteobacteria bacterium]
MTIKKGLTLVELLIALIISILLIGGLIGFVFFSFSYLEDLNSSIEEFEFNKSLNRFFEKEFSRLVVVLPRKLNQIKIGNALYMLPTSLDLQKGFHYVKRSDPRQGIYFTLCSLNIRGRSLILSQREVLEGQIMEKSSDIELVPGVKFFQFLLYDSDADSAVGSWVGDWNTLSIPHLILIALKINFNGKSLDFFRIYRVQNRVLN